MREPLVVSIILNWNGIAIKYKNKSILDLTLKTYGKVKYENLKTIVVDAESSDSSIKFLQKNFKNYDILKVKNKGFAYANNMAIKYAFKKYKNLDYILLLNDDLIFNESNWLKKLIKASESNNEIGITGCKLIYPDGRVCEGGGYTEKFYTLINVKPRNIKNGYVKGVIGAVFLIKRKVLESIGLFDEVYLPFFKEETDFCERARKWGFKIYYVNNTNITHLERYSTFKAKIKRKWSKDYITYTSIRNDWIFLLRWYKYLFLLNVVYQVIQAFISIEPNFRIRAYTEVTARLKFTIKGIFEAIKLYKKRKVPKLCTKLTS